MPFEGTPAYTNNTLGKHDHRFRAFKEFVRRNVDLPMLQRVYPIGTVLRESPLKSPAISRSVDRWGHTPILAMKIRYGSPNRPIIDAVVVDWGMPSVTAYRCQWRSITFLHPH